MVGEQVQRKQTVTGSTWRGRRHWTRSAHRATRSTWLTNLSWCTGAEFREDRDEQDPSTGASHPRCSWTRHRDVSGGRGNGVGMFSGSDADMERLANQNKWIHQSRRPVDRQKRDTDREVLTHHQHRAKQRRLRTRERPRTKPLRRVDCTHG